MLKLGFIWCYYWYKCVFIDDCSFSECVFHQRNFFLCQGNWLQMLIVIMSLMLRLVREFMFILNRQMGSN